MESIKVSKPDNLQYMQTVKSEVNSKKNKSKVKIKSSPKKKKTRKSETKNKPSISAKSTFVNDVMFKRLELSYEIKNILIQEAFRMFDADESGFIDKKEFRKLIQSLGLEMNPKKIDELMKSVDKDGSGSIDYEEFASMMLKYQFNENSAISTHLESAFNLYDKDDDGIISEQDIAAVALELDEDLNQDEALIIINLAKTLMDEMKNIPMNDTEIVGITKEEFVNLLLKTGFLIDLGENPEKQIDKSDKNVPGLSSSYKNTSKSSKNDENASQKDNENEKDL